MALIPAPDDKEALVAWLRLDLPKELELLGNPGLLQMRVMHVAPDKPRRGLVVFADGTDWNPGSGEGVYVYTTTGWRPL